MEIGGLDDGERAALSLAVERRADLLLVDDRRGRRAAMTLNLRIVGTVGILELAAERDLLDLGDVFRRLRDTDFSVADELLEAALRRHANQRRSPS